LLAPKSAIREALQFRKYKPCERGLYLKIRMLDGLGMRKNKTPKDLSRARSILFVCFGNIMRSAMCEALMKEKLSGIPQVRLNIISAGLNATPGREAHPWGVAVAPQFGVSLDNHRARLVSAAMVDEADVIFAMDYQNQVELLTRYPGAREKVFMLSAYADPDYHSVEIRDPFYGDEDETRRCYGILQTCVHNLVCALRSSMPQSKDETPTASRSEVSQ
jgi:protein-tyrosine-phosphatase